MERGSQKCVAVGQVVIALLGQLELVMFHADKKFTRLMETVGHGHVR